MASRSRTLLRQKLQYLHSAYIDLRLFLTGKSDPELPPAALDFLLAP